ncbi:ABC transporter permease [soil metagenome]
MDTVSPPAPPGHSPRPGAPRPARARPVRAAPQRPAAPRFQRLRVLFALVIREMGMKFGRSLGGYFWAIAQPLGGIVLLAIGFSLALRSPPLGTSFILFYATGIIPFTIYTTMANGVSGAVRTNRGLLTYPVVTALDAILAKFVLNFMTILMIGVGLSSGIILILGLHVNLDLAAIAIAFTLAALVGLGVGTLNCVLFGFFPTWKNVWGVLTRPLFLLSGIFYVFEMVPASFQALILWNPLIHVIGLMRSGFFGTYDPSYVSYPYVLGVAGGSFVLGAYLLRRHESHLIEQ